MSRACRDDDEMLDLLDQYQVDYVVLARYMRILPPATCWKYAGGRIINLHHGLLPSFPGPRPYHDAFAARMLTYGATCHFIVPELDAGNQTIFQSTFTVPPGMKLDDIIRIGQEDNEPRCLVEGVRRVVDREIKLHFHRVVGAAVNDPSKTGLEERKNADCLNSASAPQTSHAPGCRGIGRSRKLGLMCSEPTSPLRSRVLSHCGWCRVPTKRPNHCRTWSSQIPQCC